MWLLAYEAFKGMFQYSNCIGEIYAKCLEFRALFYRFNTPIVSVKSSQVVDYKLNENKFQYSNCIGEMH